MYSEIGKQSKDQIKSNQGRITPDSTQVCETIYGEVSLRKSLLT